MSKQILQQKQRQGQALLSSRGTGSTPNHQRVDSTAGLLEDRKEVERWLDDQLLSHKNSLNNRGPALPSHNRMGSDQQSLFGHQNTSNQEKLLHLRKQIEHQDSGISLGIGKRGNSEQTTMLNPTGKPQPIGEDDFENQMDQIVQEIEGSKSGIQQKSSFFREGNSSKTIDQFTRQGTMSKHLSPNVNKQYGQQYSQNLTINDPIMERQREESSHSMVAKSNIVSMILQQSQKDKSIMEEEKNIQEASQFRSREILKRQRTYTQDYKTLATIADPEGLDESMKKIEKLEAFVKKMCKCCFKPQIHEEFDPYSYTSGESDEECKFEWLRLDEHQRSRRIFELWKRTLAKARGAVQVLNTFGDLNRKIYIHGSTKKHEYLEEQDKIKPLPIIIMPYSKVKNFWNIVVMLLLLYTGVYIPYKTAFIEDSPDYVNYIELSIDSLFFIDLIINFLSAYEDSDKNIEIRLSRIAFSYIRSWFLIDVISCIPFQLLDFGGDDSSMDNNGTVQSNPFDNLRLLQFINSTIPNSGGSGGSKTNVNSQNYKYLKLARLPRLYRLLRILRLFKIVRILKYNRTIKRLFDQMKLNPGYVKVSQVTITVLFLVHLVSCFYYMIASFTDFDPNCWVVKWNLQDADNIEQYISAVYWTFQTLTTVGYGDSYGGTTLERVFAILWMIFGIACYSFTIGNLQSIISTIDAKSSELASKINTLTGFTKRTKLPDQIVIKIKKFLENNNVSSINLLESKTLLSELPASIRAEVIKQTFQDIINKIKFFEKKDPDFLWAFLPVLKPMKVYSKDILYNQGDHPEEVFFIFQGRVKLVYDITEGRSDIPVNVPFNMYVEGSYFGDLEILLSRYKKLGRDSTAIVDSECHLLVIGSKEIKQVLKHFVDVKAQMIGIAKKRRSHHKRAIQEAKQKIDEKKAKALKSTIFQGSKNILNQLAQQQKNKNSSGRELNVLKAAKNSRKKLEQLEKKRLGINNDTSRHMSQASIKEEEEEDIGGEYDQEEDDDEEDEEYDDEDDGAGEDKNKGAQNNPTIQEQIQQQQALLLQTPVIGNLDSIQKETENQRKESSKVIGINVEPIQKNNELKLDTKEKLMGQEPNPQYQIKVKQTSELSLARQSQTMNAINPLFKDGAVKFLSANQESVTNFNFASPNFKLPTPAQQQKQEQPVVSGSQQVFIEEFNINTPPNKKKEEKTYKKSQFSNKKQKRSKSGKKDSARDNHEQLNKDQGPADNEGDKFVYDHELQMRLFNDTQSALALNAYEINEITDIITQQSQKRNESLNNIEKSNENISRSLNNMENLLNKILESI